MRQQVKVDCFNCQLALFFVFPGLFFFCLCPCQRVSCNVTKFKFYYLEVEDEYQMGEWEKELTKVYGPSINKKIG